MYAKDFHRTAKCTHPFESYLLNILAFRPVRAKVQQQRTVLSLRG